MRAGLRHERSDERGMTLLELMIGLFLGGVLMVGVLNLWQQAQLAYMHGAEAADLQQNLRVGMDRMVRIIQAAGVNPKNRKYAGISPDDAAFTAFRFAGRNCLRLYADLDGVNNVQGTDENVNFRWTGTALDPLLQEAGGGPDTGVADPPGTFVAGVSTGNQELALNIVANPGGVDIFQYFTGPSDATPNTQLLPPAGVCANMTDVNRTRIGRIVITLTGQATVAGQTFKKTLVSEARPRNAP